MKKFLFEISEILEGRERKLERETTFSEPDEVSRMFSRLQVPLENEGNAKFFRGKSYQEVKVEESFWQTLHDWWKEGKITNEEINKLREFELNGKYTLKQLKEVLEEDAHVNESPIISNFTTEYTDFLKTIRDNLSNSLKRVRPKLALIIKEETEVAGGAGGGGNGNGTEIIPFSTWFNADCATIVSKLKWIKLFDVWDVWVAIKEKPVRKMGGLVDIIWVSAHSNKDKARETAAVVREKMNGENPALCIAPSLQVFYNNNDYLFVNIIKVDLPINGDIVKNPNKYLLPLDIIERGGGSSSSSSSSSSGGGSCRHVAIYLGWDSRNKKHKVCHIYADGPSSSGSSSVSSSSSSGTTLGGSGSGSATLSSASTSEKKKAKVRIDDWETFLTDNPKELIRYRITAPFKKYEKEIEQIAKAAVTEFGKGNYHLVDRNCEHFAFAISCGVNFSEQEQLNRDKWYRKFLYHRGDKIEKMDLEREMNRSNQLFNNLSPGEINLEDIEESTTSKRVTDKFKEINQWSEDRKLFVKEELQEKQEAKVEVRVIMPPKYHNWK